MTEFKHIQFIIHHDPDIFEFIFKNNSTDAINDYVSAMFVMANYLRDENKLHQPIHILVDVAESGLYSLRYALTRIKDDLLSRTQDLPRAYFAYITDDTGDRMLIEQFQYMQNTRQKDSRKVFGTTERDQAISWLLSKTEA